ncbi:UNVERIFIED_CONTAM: hypothetical protein FKN15_074762 [Acipenser sinensis]
MLPGVGVFGTSLTARVIIPLLKNEGFSVKALWGRTQEEAEELAKEMNVPFYTYRIDDVLLHQDVDLVCINLPPPLTRQIAVKTLVCCSLMMECRSFIAKKECMAQNRTWRLVSTQTSPGESNMDDSDYQNITRGIEHGR